MKKLFLFLSIFMFAFVGSFFVACSKDRYEDLKISVDSVTSTSGNKIEYKDGYYIVQYDDEFVVNSSVTCSNEINTSLTLTSNNPDVLHRLTTSNTSNGSKATFKATAPTGEENSTSYFSIRISSVETPRNSKTLKIKVILPVSEIVLKNNLAMTKAGTLNLNSSECLTYISVDPTAPFETNEKGANFALLKYTDELGENTYDLYTKEEDNSTYYFVNKNNEEIKAFVLLNGKLSLAQGFTDGGKVQVLAKSIKYNNALDELDPTTATSDQLQQIEANNKLKTNTEIKIVKDITFSDVSFMGGQVVFSDYNTDGKVETKLNSSLYINSSNITPDTYKVGEKEYNYLSENISFKVYTSEKIKISAVLSNVTLNGKRVDSDNSVVRLENPSASSYNPISNAYGIIGYETNIKLIADGNSGNAYIDFVIEYEDFSNKISYSFSQLYQEYLKSTLTQEELDALSELEKSGKVNVETSAIPSNILLYADDKKANTDDEIKIFDSYGTNNSAFGTKINANLALSSGTISQRIKDENKTIRVYISDSSKTGQNVNQFFILSDAGKNTMPALAEEVIDGVTYYYFDLDLTKNPTGTFYIKARGGENLANDATFDISFANIISSTITTSIGEVIAANSENTTLKSTTNSLKLKTVKGVEDIVVLTKITSDSGDTIYALDNVNKDSSTIYTQLVLQLTEEKVANKDLGTLIVYKLTDKAQNLITTQIDDSFIKLYDLSADLTNFETDFANSYKDLKLNGAFSIVGIKAGKTTLTLTAENGYKVVVDIEIVEPFQENSLVVQAIADKGAETIVQNTLNEYGKEQRVVAKIKGAFNLTYDVKPNKSSIHSIVYTSSNPSFVTVDANGKVNTLSVGESTISVEVSYYSFAKVGSFSQWISKTETKTFVVEVFIPATKITLNKSVVNVYDYNSLGYEYKDQATVAVSVLISPASAKIANDLSCVSYYLADNNHNLIGSETSKGVYTAYLNQNQISARVIICVDVTEYGKTTTLYCTVNITKAPQVESINFTAFEGNSQRKVNDGGLDENGHKVWYLSTQNSRTITFNTSIIPTERNVLIDDLVVAVYKAEQPEGAEIPKLLGRDETHDYGSLSYSSLKGATSVITSGLDRFNLTMGDKVSGYFYLMIFARDSMQNDSSANTYVKILVQITNGTQENPYNIETVQQFVDIGIAPDKHYVLGANINLGSISSWKPIKNFTGSLNGFNKNIATGTYFEVSGLKINSISSENVGLFEVIGNSADKVGAVLNLNLKVSSINLQNYTVSEDIAADTKTINIGTIAGTNRGVILNSSVTFDNFRVSLKNRNANVGGVVGANESIAGFNTGLIINFSYSLDKSSNAYNLSISDSDSILSWATASFNKEEFEDYIISTHPLSGTIYVSDKEYVTIGDGSEGLYEGYSVNVGGVAGISSGFINGLYGLYSYKNDVAVATAGQSSSVQYYLTNYQSQGVDLTININSGKSDTSRIYNYDSNIGGVVGYLYNGGAINNFSAEGNIGKYNKITESVSGTYNNVGGIVGNSKSVNSLNEESEIQNSINNISTSVRVRGNYNVGGAAGVATQTNFNKVRVESYESLTDDVQQLVIGNGAVGGVVGASYSSKFEYVYSYSFINDFNADYIKYGDVLLLGTDTATENVAGGIAGIVGNSINKENIYVNYVYSTFNISTKCKNAYISGILGLAEKPANIFKNVIYVGALINGTEGEENSNSISSPLYIYSTYVEEGESSNVEYTIVNDVTGVYFAYYILKYEDITISGSNQTALVLDSFKAGDESLIDNSENPILLSGEKYLKVSCYELVEENYVVKEISLPVPYYITISTSGNIVCPFIRFIPTQISVKANGSEVVEEDETFILDFKTDENKNFYYSLNENGEYELIINYSAINNVFSLNDLFEVVPTPTIKGNLNILVNASKELTSSSTGLSITSDGELCITNTGVYNLTFVVKENVTAKYILKVVVIKNFDKLLVANTPTFKDSLFNTSEEEALDLRVNNNINMFNLFAEYVTSSEKISYEVVDDGTNIKYLTEINNSNNYKIGFEIEYKDADQATFHPINEDQYELVGNSLTFKVVSLYKINLFVTFSADGKNFKITNPDWLVYINVFAGATSASFNPVNDVWIQGQEIYDTLQFVLISDVATVTEEDVVLVVSDANGMKYTYNYIEGNYSPEQVTIANTVTGEEPKTYTRAEIESVNSDVKIPFDISVSPVGGTVTKDTHYFNLVVSVRDDFKYVDKSTYYTLQAYDKDEVLINNPANINIVVVPQTLKGVSAIHYAYSRNVSKLENVANTEADYDEDSENLNYSYSFSSQPKDTVVAGNEGLFIIDLYPMYANITSVAIDSSIDEDSGNALQFVQLVKMTKRTDSGSSAGNYYVNAPIAKSSGNNGIFLNLYSYVPDYVAFLTGEKADKIEYGVDNVDKKMSYAFGSSDQENTDTARLYVKTYAPTNLKEQEQFTVRVTVKYQIVDETGSLVEREYVYTHSLVVESMPGFSMSVMHDGEERDVIAYTASGTNNATTEDWVDVVPRVEEGYTYDSISCTLEREGKYVSGATDYVVFNNNRITLGQKAQIGDKIKITAVVKVNYDGYIETRVYTKYVTIVDVVIESITVKDLDSNDFLKITVSTSRQLKAVINGYGTENAIEEAQNLISRSVTADYNFIYYWQAKSTKSGEQYVNLESVSIRNSLPFVVNKVAINNDVKTIKVDSDTFIGAVSGQGEVTLDSMTKVVVLEGSTESGSVDMRLTLSYVYNPVDGTITFVPNTFATKYTKSKYFKVVVTEDSNEDNPTPVYDEEDLINMSKTSTGSYILMNDIVIKNHTALEANFSSFDGNNKIITIQSFAYSTNLSSSNADYSINLGLFNTVSSKTIIKNVIVALPADKAVAMDLKCYTTINYGGICAVNEGVVTNCDVITVSDRERATLSNYNNFNYALNIETATQVDKKEVTANIGGLVGVNKGFVTNSRVGRDSVDILNVYDSEATVVYKEEYTYTAPITLIKVVGRANVGGFVASNSGTISTSYAKNIQLEVISESSSRYVKTGGFVATNDGFIYGSFSAGWEEEDALNAQLTELVSSNRKLGGGLFSNGFIGGFVFHNAGYIEDCYSNINVSGDPTFAAQTNYIIALKNNQGKDMSSPAVGGFVYRSVSGSYIYTSYSLSKIHNEKYNTYGAFEGREGAPDPDFDNSGEITNCYFMLEKTEDFNYDHERARKLSDDPVIDLESSETTTGTNEFINKSSFNNFSFDNSITDFNNYSGTSKGGVWAVYKRTGTNNGYPELISANTIAISCRVINVTKTNNSDTNKYYYTYVDGYDLGSYLNPYIISSFDQYNNIFKDTIGSDINFNDNITTKFTGNIRLVKNINFANSEEVYSTSVEYTSLVSATSIFDGNYLAMYNIKLSDKSSGTSGQRTSFGLFKNIYYAAVKNLTLGVTSVSAGNTTTVGALAGVIVNSNISNITLVSATEDSGVITGNNYVGGLAGIILSQDDSEFYTVSNIKSNLAVVGSTSTESSITAITTSKIVWERIKPTSNSSGLSEVNNNLRLHRLPNNVYYAGGIAGLVDMNQVNEATDTEINNANVYNIHVGEFTPNTILSSEDANYTSLVSIISDYSGGLFGFMGAETYLECGEFIAVAENEKHFISANRIAGGITAVNLGKISQCYVSFNKETVKSLNDSIVNYVNQQSGENVQINNTLFASGRPEYIGGIAGINVGNGTSRGTGTILDCYNRVNVKNTHAKGVGGIVGASYIGQISNVYTTASLLGDLTNTNTKIGAIIGKIFENGDEGYFADYYTDGGEFQVIELFNIVALNLWDTQDFDDLYEFVNVKNGKIGALYGEYKNKKSTGGAVEEEGLVRITGFVFVQSYALKDFTCPYISTDEAKDGFDVNKFIEDGGECFGLWGVQINTREVDGEVKSFPDDDYLASMLCAGEDRENIITPNDYMALLSSTEFGVSTLRNTYFPENKWSRVIWNYDDENLVPILEYGYESSVIRIYTAHQFVAKLKEGNSSGKMYVIMNDLDFSDIKNEDLPITTTFRGQLYGNNVSYGDFVRKPILFNVSLKDTERSTSIFAIMQNSIGATYSNFNIVLKDYDIQYKNIKSETITSVLLANATNTTVNNVNIYSSINDIVNTECILDYKFSSSVQSDIKSYSVAKGYNLNKNTKEIQGFSQSFIKLATLDPTNKNSTDQESFLNQYILVYRSTDASTRESKFELTEEKIFNAETNTFETKNYNKNESGVELIVHGIDKAKTNATTVGLLIGSGSLSYVTSSSVNVDLEVTFDNAGFTSNASLLSRNIGAVVGKNIGELRYVVSTSSVTVNANSNFTASGLSADINQMYVGGIAGSVQGVLRFVYVKNSDINVGTNSRYVVANTGSAGVFVGGIVGGIDRYTTVNEAIIGGANFLYITDVGINTYVTGTSSVAGAIAQNSFTLGDVYYKQSKDSTKAINVNIKDENTSSTVGGIVAVNKSTYITNAYTNTSIYANIAKCSNINIGGIVGSSLDNDCDIQFAVNDAKEIKINKTENNLINNVVIGGLVAKSSTSAKFTKIRNVISTVNIITEQERNLCLGGVVGEASSLITSDLIVLGDITIKKGKGEGKYSDAYTVNGVNMPSSLNSTYYYYGSHYIGGLVGNCSTSYSQDTDSNGVLVLGTIRDYALAQKTNVNIGPVIGSNNKFVSSESKTYFCEPISLVADNGYNEYFKNIDQLNLVDGLETENFIGFKKLFDQLFTGYSFGVDTSKEVYSNYYTNYYSLDNSGFMSGSKLNPITNPALNSLDENKYYILTENKTVTTAMNDKENWLLNAQGHTITTNGGPVFDTIPNGSAIVGVLSTFNGNLATSGVLAKNNYGFIFASGTSGSINEGAGAASLVYGNYGVINACFSILDIYVKMNSSGAGLVVENGKDDYVGNIFSSYHTGTITPLNTGTTLAGIAVNSSKGIISNCYTMGDIDVTEYSTSNIYPVANTVGKSNIYNTYYDYVAYASEANVGVNISSVSPDAYEAIGLFPSQAQQVAYITTGGIFVWSSTLAGDEGGLNYTSISGILKGSWLTPGSKEELCELFKKTTIYKNNQKLTDLDTSWFNYGYTTINMLNILVNDTSSDNVFTYFEMLYTGNGLKDENNTTVGEYGFIDQPYKIKHAGMLDILVKANNANQIKFKYYRLIKNIDFIKYTGSTYWSQSWDDSYIVFVGDLNGNAPDGKNKRIMNMYSSYGLLRALPNIESEEKTTTVRNLVFENCYSKTGLIAGFMGTGVIKNISIADKTTTGTNAKSYVINGKANLLDNVINEDTKMRMSGGSDQNIIISFNSILIDRINLKIPNSSNPKIEEDHSPFAGGLIGFMQNGTISNTDSSLNIYNLYVAVNTNSNSKECYAGGLVGIMVGGSISGSTNSPLNIYNINVYSYVTGEQTTAPSYVGGVVGYMLTNALTTEAPKIANVTISNLKLYSTYGLGGIVGRLFDGTISNCTYSANNSAIISNVEISGNNGVSGSVATNLKTNVNSERFMFGGIAGEMIGGTITGSTISKQFLVNSFSKNTQTGSKIYVGGVVGSINKFGSSSPEINNCSNEGGTSVTITVSNTKLYSGGIAGNMSNGKIAGSTNTGAVYSNNSNNSVSGGVVGLLTNGTLTASTSNAGDVTGNITAGGVVGEVYITDGNDSSDTVTILSKNTNGNIQVNSSKLTYNSNKYYQGSKTGGLVGVINANITSSTSDKKFVTISGASVINTTVGSSNSAFSGGLVGAVFNSKNKSNIVITNSTSEASIQANSGTVTGTGNKLVTIAGGIVAYAYGVEVTNCVNKGSVGASESASYAGGVVGYAYNSSITSCENTNSVKANKVAGGVVGILSLTSGIYNNAKNSGEISNNSGSSIAGGVVGILESGDFSQNNDYRPSNSSKVGGDNTLVAGGIVGVYKNNINNTIRFVNNTGAVSAGSTTSIGNLVSASKVTYNSDAGVYCFESEEKTNILESVNANGAGGIVGYVAGSVYIAEVTNSGSGEIYATNNAGGIVGFANSSTTISNLTNAKSVRALDCAGGIVGQASNNVKLYSTAPKNDASEHFTYGAIINTGAIGSDSTKKAGGVAGIMNNATMGDQDNGLNVKNSGSVKATENAGGLIGILSSGNMFGGTNSGSVNATSGNAGGLVGLCDNGSIKNGTNTSSVTGSANAGGIVGSITGGTVESTCSTNMSGTIKATNAGGIAGIVTSSGKILATFNSATFDGTYVGGQAGKMEGGSVEGKTAGGVSGGTATGGAVGIMTGGTLKATVNSSVTVSGTNDVGGLVGVLENCSLTGGTAAGVTVSSSNTAGGIVGCIRNGGTVSGGTGGNASGTNNAGGVAGYVNNGSISNGTGGSASGESAGGLVGLLKEGTVSGGTAGTVSGGTNRGGLVGTCESGGTILGGNAQSVHGGTSAGGIVGNLVGGTVSGGKGAGVSGAKNAGGIAGSMSGGTISSGCSNEGDVSGTEKVGGVVGSASNGATISGGKTIGSVTGGDNAGGTVGFLTGGATITSSAGGASETVSGKNAGGAVGQMSGSCKVEGGGAGGFINGSYNCGGAVGCADDVDCVINLNFSGSISKTYNSGGILGYGSASINSTSVNVSGIGSGDREGGIVGRVYGTIYLGNSISVTTSSNYAITYTVPGNSTIGSGYPVKTISSSKPLTYSNYGTLTYLASSGGSFNASNNSTFGAITSVNGGSINGCENNSNISGMAGNVGGIAGSNTGTINKCVNNATIISGAGSANIGGIVGTTSGSFVGGENKGTVKFSSDTAVNIYGRSCFSSENANKLRSNVCVGGVAGEVTGGRVVGTSNGNIYNNIKYISGGSSANITDYRGLVAGNKTGGTVTNSAGHSGLTTSGDASKKEYVGAINYIALGIVPSEDTVSWSDDDSGTNYDPGGAVYFVYYKDYGTTNPNNGVFKNASENYKTDNYKKELDNIKGKDFVTSSGSYIDISTSMGTWIRKLSDSTRSSYYYAQGDLNNGGSSGGGSDDSAWGKKRLSSDDTFVSIALEFIQDNNKYPADKYEYKVGDDVIALAFVHDGFVLFGNGNVTGAVVMIPIREYKLTPDEREVTIDKLQDCGGNVPDQEDSAEYKTRKGCEIAALKVLYDMCGPCSGSGSTGTVTDVSGIGGTPSGGSSGGGGSGGEAVPTGDLSNITLTGDYLNASKHIGGSPYSAAAANALAIGSAPVNHKVAHTSSVELSSGWCNSNSASGCTNPSYSRIVHYKYDMHFYSNSYDGDARVNSNAQKYNLQKTINYITSGYQIYTDCFGFVRLCYASAGLGLSGWAGGYGGSYLTSKDQLKPGSILENYERHVAIFLYWDGDTAYYIDQQCKVSTGTWSSGNGIKYGSSSYFGRYQNLSVSSTSSLSSVSMNSTCSSAYESAKSSASSSSSKYLQVAENALRIASAPCNTRITHTGDVTLSAGYGNTCAGSSSACNNSLFKNKIIHYRLGGLKSDDCYGYSYEYTGDPRENTDNPYQSLSKALKYISSGYQIYTDCLGFVKLCYASAGFSTYGKSGYYNRSYSHTITSLSQLSPGMVLENRYQHVAIFLYASGNTVYYIDEQLKVYDATWTGSGISYSHGNSGTFVYYQAP